MTPYERSNLWLQTATLIVLTITLIGLAVYTGYTRTLANAAVEEISIRRDQAEQVTLAGSRRSD